MEIYTSVKQPAAYLVDELILFEHPTAREGRLVTIKETDYEITNNLAELRLDLGETVDTPYKGAHGHLGYNVQFYAPGVLAESDIIGEDDGTQAGDYMEAIY